MDHRPATRTDHGSEKYIYSYIHGRRRNKKLLTNSKQTGLYLRWPVLKERADQSRRKGTEKESEMAARLHCTDMMHATNQSLA